MGQPSDEALARRAQAGDADAFAALVNRHQRMVLNLAYRMLGDAQEAEDVAQDYSSARTNRSAALTQGGAWGGLRPPQNPTSSEESKATN